MGSTSLYVIALNMGQILSCVTLFLFLTTASHYGFSCLEKSFRVTAVVLFICNDYCLANYR